MTQQENDKDNKQETKKPNDQSGVMIQGHIKIWDPESGEIIVDKRNAIHYENMSIALAESIGNAGQGWIYEMSFGNGGTRGERKHGRWKKKIQEIKILI